MMSAQTIPHPQGTDSISICTHYYHLDKAAKIIGCDAEDILHIGASGHADILAPVLSPGEYIWPDPVIAPHILEGNQYQVAFDASDRVILSSKDLLLIEAQGWVTPDFFYCASRVMEATDGVIAPQSEVKRLHEYARSCPWTLIQPDDAAEKITISHLFISSGELKRIMDGGPQDEATEARKRQETQQAKTIHPKTENKLHATVAALARLYTKTDCSKPYEAAETIIQAFELAGISAAKKDALAEYIQTGNERLETESH